MIKNQTNVEHFTCKIFNVLHYTHENIIKQFQNLNKDEMLRNLQIKPIF